MKVMQRWVNPYSNNQDIVYTDLDEYGWVKTGTNTVSGNFYTYNEIIDQQMDDQIFTMVTAFQPDLKGKAADLSGQTKPAFARKNTVHSKKNNDGQLRCLQCGEVTRSIDNAFGGQYNICSNQNCVWFGN